MRKTSQMRPPLSKFCWFREKMRLLLIFVLTMALTQSNGAALEEFEVGIDLKL